MTFSKQNQEVFLAAKRNLLDKREAELTDELAKDIVLFHDYADRLNISEELSREDIILILDLALVGLGSLQD